MSKILITDDSRFMRSILKTILAGAGYLDVIEASDGEEAIKLVNSNHPDLVLLDIIMPTLNGIKALENIGSVVPVVMVTAVGQEEMIKKALELGAKDYIIKPFNARKVLEIVKKVLVDSGR